MQADDNIVRIPLRARDGSVRAYAIVDFADADWVNQWRWHLGTDGYAYRTDCSTGRNKTILLHRALLGLTTGDGMEGDHLDFDTLNNCRSNLRILTRTQHLQHVRGRRNASSTYRGVSWDRTRNKWVAQLKVGGKKIFLGRFDQEIDAASAARAGRVRLLPYSLD